MEIDTFFPGLVNFLFQSEKFIDASAVNDGYLVGIESLSRPCGIHRQKLDTTHRRTCSVDSNQASADHCHTLTYLDSVTLVEIVKLVDCLYHAVQVISGNIHVTALHGTDSEKYGVKALFLQIAKIKTRIDSGIRAVFDTKFFESGYFTVDDTSR